MACSGAKWVCEMKVARSNPGTDNLVFLFFPSSLMSSGGATLVQKHLYTIPSSSSATRMGLGECLVRTAILQAVVCVRMAYSGAKRVGELECV